MVSQIKRGQQKLLCLPLSSPLLAKSAEIDGTSQMVMGKA